MLSSDNFNFFQVYLRKWIEHSVILCFIASDAPYYTGQKAENKDISSVATYLTVPSLDLEGWCHVLMIRRPSPFILSNKVRSVQKEDYSFHLYYMTSVSELSVQHNISIHKIFLLSDQTMTFLVI